MTTISTENMEAINLDDMSTKTTLAENSSPVGSLAIATNHAAEGLQRRLDNRQIQLIAIGGSIGTAIFITIGTGLASGGPASLLLAYILHCLVMSCVNNSLAELATLYPVEGGFISLATHFVDPAIGFMVGWNFFLYEALLIPFEISAINVVLGYWRSDIPVWAVCVGCIVAYGTLNCFAVRGYGESEFWLSSGKVILLFILFMFTFVTSIGGNSQHDAYGFRYWSTPFAPITGHIAQFKGFLTCLSNAAFTIVGPEYIAMAAAETKRPRKHIKTAYKVMYGRFLVFFVLSALCVGMIVPWNDPALQAALNDKTKSVATSPYIIAMSNMSVDILPHIVNALVITSIFSAGNAYTFCASRTLHGLAVSGQAPPIFQICTKSGVPIYALAATMLFPFLSLLQLSAGADKVLVWLVEVITAGALVDFVVISITYVMFYKACIAQGLDRRRLPYVGRFQPYCGWIGGIFTAVVCLGYGYGAFMPWDYAAFFRTYAMTVLDVALFVTWKLCKGTQWLKPKEIDLVWQRPAIDAYEDRIVEQDVGFWGEIVQMFGLRTKRSNGRSAGSA